MTKIYFNPGCALSIYKPEMEEKILKFLNEHYGEVLMHKICCHHAPKLAIGSLVITACSGCGRRFVDLYEGLSTISLWEVLDQIENFPYPNYDGLTISIHDACPARSKPQVHKAVRSLLTKMNIKVVETQFHGIRSICCGDSFYNKLSIEQVHQQMKNRANAMPYQEVCVYCISCIKSFHIGGKTPRYLLDLLMNETTEIQTYHTKEWHEQLQKYIDDH